MSFFDLARNLRRDASDILSNHRGGDGAATLCRYLKLTAREVGIRRGLLTSPQAERVSRRRLAAFHTYGALRSIWREIYGGSPYYFECRSHVPVIFDVGSNIGISVLYFSDLYPDATITAFEPDPETFKLLSHNVKLNKLDVQLVNKAVYGETGELPWHGAEPGCLGSSLIQRNLQSATTVGCVRLSDYVKGHVDLLKLDVEGVEREVLGDLAASRAIERIDQLLIEFHPWAGWPLEQMETLLKDNGFEVHRRSGFVVRAKRN
jgi:FkbM family methyltransferase